MKIFNAFNKNLHKTNQVNKTNSKNNNDEKHLDKVNDPKAFVEYMNHNKGPFPISANYLRDVQKDVRSAHGGLYSVEPSEMTMNKDGIGKVFTIMHGPLAGVYMTDMTGGNLIHFSSEKSVIDDFAESSRLHGGGKFSDLVKNKVIKTALVGAVMRAMSYITQVAMSPEREFNPQEFLTEIGYGAGEAVTASVVKSILDLASNAYIKSDKVKKIADFASMVMAFMAARTVTGVFEGSALLIDQTHFDVVSQSLKNALSSTAVVTGGLVAAKLGGEAVTALFGKGATWGKIMGGAFGSALGAYLAGMYNVPAKHEAMEELLKNSITIGGQVLGREGFAELCRYLYPKIEDTASKVVMNSELLNGALIKENEQNDLATQVKALALKAAEVSVGVIVGVILGGITKLVVENRAAINKASNEEIIATIKQSIESQLKNTTALKEIIHNEIANATNSLSTERNLLEVNNGSSAARNLLGVEHTLYSGDDNSISAMFHRMFYYTVDAIDTSAAVSAVAQVNTNCTAQIANIDTQLSAIKSYIATNNISGLTNTTTGELLDLTALSYEFNPDQTPLPSDLGSSPTNVAVDLSGRYYATFVNGFGDQVKFAQAEIDSVTKEPSILGSQIHELQTMRIKLENLQTTLNNVSSLLSKPVPSSVADFKTAVDSFYAPVQGVHNQTHNQIGGYENKLQTQMSALTETMAPMTDPSVGLPVFTVDNSQNIYNILNNTSPEQIRTLFMGGDGMTTIGALNSLNFTSDTVGGPTFAFITNIASLTRSAFTNTAPDIASNATLLGESYNQFLAVADPSNGNGAAFTALYNNILDIVASKISISFLDDVNTTYEPNILVRKETLNIVAAVLVGSLGAITASSLIYGAYKLIQCCRDRMANRRVSGESERSNIFRAPIDSTNVNLGQSRRDNFSESLEEELDVGNRNNQLNNAQILDTVPEIHEENVSSRVKRVEDKGIFVRPDQQNRDTQTVATKVTDQHVQTSLYPQTRAIETQTDVKYEQPIIENSPPRPSILETSEKKSSVITPKKEGVLVSNYENILTTDGFTRVTGAAISWMKNMTMKGNFLEFCGKAISEIDIALFELIKNKIKLFTSPEDFERLIIPMLKELKERNPSITDKQISRIDTSQLLKQMQTYAKFVRLLKEPPIVDTIKKTLENELLEYCPVLSTIICRRYFNYNASLGLGSMGNMSMFNAADFEKSVKNLNEYATGRNSGDQKSLSAIKQKLPLEVEQKINSFKREIKDLSDKIKQAPSEQYKKVLKTQLELAEVKLADLMNHIDDKEQNSNLKKEESSLVNEVNRGKSPPSSYRTPEKRIVDAKKTQSAGKLPKDYQEMISEELSNESSDLEVKDIIFKENNR